MTLIQDLDGARRHLRKHFTELIASPFHAVKSQFGEHLQRAVRDFIVVLGVVL